MINIFLFFILMALLSHGIFCLNCYSSSSDINSLQQIYNGAKGYNWTWEIPYSTNGYPWNFTAKSPNPCSTQNRWQGIECDSKCVITSLSLSSLNLDGTLSPYLGNLTGLTSLTINNNPQLIGVVPYQLENLLSLQFIDLDSNNLAGIILLYLIPLIELSDIILYNNHFIGSIPSDISKLTKLQYLEIEQNHFSNTIPSSIGDLINLKAMLIYENMLTGSIPDSISKLTSLQYLDLFNNLFTSSLPSNIINLKNIIDFEIESNLFTGSIPSNISNWSNLRNFDLDSNLFTGNIPLHIGSCTKLQNIYLYNNLLTGTIPISICNLLKLETLELYENFFSGSIPFSIGNLTSLLVCSLDRNLLTSSIPSSIGYLSKLRYLMLNENALSGSLPSQIGSLHLLFALVLSRNQFSSNLPNNFSSLTNLEYIFLHENKFTGSLPNSFTSLTSLAYAYMYQNQFTGSLPRNFGHLSNLLVFEIYDNSFTGPIPSSIGNCTLVEHLYINNNLFSSSLPQMIGNLSQLTFFDLNSNSFTSSLPNSIGNCTKITQIFANNNFFSGVLPFEISYLTASEELFLDNNLFTGTLSPHYDSLSSLQSFYLFNNYLTGDISIDFTTWKNFSFFEIDSNLLSSSLPSTIGSLHKLQVAYFSYNMLTGKISNIFNTLPILQDLLLQHNYFTGTLDSFVDYSNQKYLFSIDISHNLITGSFPESLFQNGSNLISFVASQNCIRTNLLQSICELDHLETLLLNGVHANEHCINPFFPGMSESYSLSTSSIQGSIPRCLFSLQSISTIQLAGNGIHDNLKDLNSLSSTLVNLTLSHNIISGPIPDSIQMKTNWQNLDLSFNKISGSLISSFYSLSSNCSDKILNNDYKCNSSISLALQVNRLSGMIPSTLYLTPNISILRGNMFDCQNNLQSLPKNDDERHYYSCGSDQVNQAFYIWIILLLFLLIFTIFMIHHNSLSLFPRNISQSFSTLINSIKCHCSLFGLYWKTCSLNLNIVYSNEKSKDSQDSDNPLESSTKIIQDILKYLNQFTSFLFSYLLLGIILSLLLLLPLYLIFSFTFGSYSSQYAWSISIAYLTGITPAIILIVCFLAISLLMLYPFQKYNLLTLFLNHIGESSSLSCLFPYRNFHTAFNSQISTNINLDNDLISKDVPVSEYAIAIFALLFLISLDAGIVLTVNMVYVYLSSSRVIPKRLSIIITLFVSLFKFLWSKFVHFYFFPWFLSIKKSQWLNYSFISNENRIFLLISMTIFFNVLAPCLALAMMSSNCFYFLITSSPEIDSLSLSCYSQSQIIYEYMKFVLIPEPIFNSTTCAISSLGHDSFEAPFSYSYQCSSQLLSSYADVMIYRYIFAGFMTPIIQLFLMIYFDSKYENSLPSKPQDNELESNINPNQEISVNNPIISTDKELELISYHLPPKDKNDTENIDDLTNTPKESVDNQIKPISSKYDSFSFNHQYYSLLLLGDLSLFLTFGFLFPPLSLVIFFTLISNIIILRLRVGRWLTYLPSDPLVRLPLLNELKNEFQALFPFFINLFPRIVIFVTLFWSFFLFDIFGDEVGWQNSLWIIFILGLSPWFMYLINNYSYLNIQGTETKSQVEIQV